MTGQPAFLDDFDDIEDLDFDDEEEFSDGDEIEDGLGFGVIDDEEDLTPYMPRLMPDET